MCHIGKKHYYNEIQKELDSEFHDIVLFEGVKSKQNKSGLTELYNMLADSMSCIGQKEGIVYSDKWKRSDLDFDILISAKPSLREKLNFDNLKIDEMQDFVKKSPFAHTIIRWFVPVLLKFASRKEFPVICDMRNYKVILDCFHELKDKNHICLFYGDNHRKGIEKFLRSVGFEQYCTKKSNPFR